MFTDDTPRAYPIVEQGKIKDARFTLEEAVTFWYKQLASTGEDNCISVDAPNRQGYPLKIGKRTLANVGFGASQILPVLGLCLSASPGDLILLEQPELHLNPGMQQKLADFLLVMSKTGRQIIVETHSEYLITRLRRNAATDSEDHKYFTIIFVERDAKTGTSYRTVNVDEQGDLSEWPKGFFDHVAEDLRILMRKAAERQSNVKSEPINTKSVKAE
jgi:predicted ATPase